MDVECNKKTQLKNWNKSKSLDEKLNVILFIKYYFINLSSFTEINILKIRLHAFFFFFFDMIFVFEID